MSHSARISMPCPSSAHFTAISPSFVVSDPLIRTASVLSDALVIVNIGISAAAPLWAMPSMFLSGAGAAAGIAMINSVGNLGGFVGPFAIGWLKNVTGGYSAGLYVVGATLAVSAIVTLMLSRQSKRTPVAVEERHGH
ncbi:hypothetical protein R54767_03075 [Paraburkholderia gardini]|uniref:Major facilitator superfamily (MFS) profile domain-containing protein n=1 Tax=Paraburkholderia gardini TaxID=2823469 RepID=A0ABM8U5R6_9BURK|nr:hypothetical protein R54767_03075 [Paraburkholderia gardini]